MADKKPTAKEPSASKAGAKPKTKPEARSPSDLARDNSQRSVADILHPFATEARHLTSALSNIASDMIRDKSLAKKLDEDPDYFRQNYPITEEELAAMRERNMPRLYELGMHPFLLVRFAGMMGILEYWQALGAPGRTGWPRNS